MYGFCLNVYVACSHRSQKRASDPLELELQLVWATMWMLRIKPGSLKEQPVLLIAEPPLQHPALLLSILRQDLTELLRLP